MSRSPKIYRRLARARGTGVNHSLWEGPDHLLLVENNHFTESYRRLYFRDLRALYLFPNRRRLWLSIVSLIPAVVGILVGFGEGPLWVVLPFIVIGTVLLSINLLLGPTVTVMVYTGAHFLPLQAIKRQRRARKVAAQIAPSIAAAQADLAPAPEPA